MIKCVVFDIGKVLWDYEPFRRGFLTEWGKLVGMSFEEIDKEYLKIYKKFHRGELEYHTWLARFRKDIDFGQTDRVVKEMVDKHLKPHLNFKIFDLIPEIQKAGLIVGCLSNIENFEKEIPRKLSQLVEFDFQILSFQVGARKPEKKIYQQIFKYVDSQPSQVLFIDDKLKNIKGAKKLGIETIHHTKTEETISAVRKELINN